MKKQFLVVLIILCVASFFRLQKINSIPNGLYYGEAAIGNSASRLFENISIKSEKISSYTTFNKIQAVSIWIFGKKIWALRVAPALIGILSVLGLFLLTKQLLNWQIAALSSHLMAISFWHVNFSRMGLPDVILPFFLIWSFYFLWKGLSSSKLFNFGLSAIFWGLGIYTGTSFLFMFLVLACALLAYWDAVRKDFEHEKYEHSKNQITRGLGLFLVVLVLLVIPLVYKTLINGVSWYYQTTSVTIFNTANPLLSLLKNSALLFTAFNSRGDSNWLHNLPGQPLLIWPVGVLFILGFLRSWIKIFAIKKRHGHFSTVQILLMSWFFVGILPIAFINEGLPDSLKMLIVSPVVFIWAGEGLWWILDKIGNWYHTRDVHEFHIKNRWMKESSIAALIALICLLISLTVSEYNRYFKEWAGNPAAANAFDQKAIELSSVISRMSNKNKIYILIRDNKLIDGLPAKAQTIMFLTDTEIPEKQKIKNIYYLNESQYLSGGYDKRSTILELK